MIHPEQQQQQQQQSAATVRAGVKHLVNLLVLRLKKKRKKSMAVVTDQSGTVGIIAELWLIDPDHIVGPVFNWD